MEGFDYCEVHSVQEYQNFIKSMMNPNLSQFELISSYTLGLCGEAGEAFRTAREHWDSTARPRALIGAFDDNLLLELGDCAHYVYGLAMLVGVTAEELTSQDRRDEVLADCEVYWRQASGMAYTLACCDLADQVKKHYFHGKDRTEEIKYGLVLCLMLLGLFCARQDISIGAVMRGNVAKLQKRHPAGFTSVYQDQAPQPSSESAGPQADPPSPTA